PAIPGGTLAICRRALPPREVQTDRLLFPISIRRLLAKHHLVSAQLRPQAETRLCRSAARLPARVDQWRLGPANMEPRRSQYCGTGRLGNGGEDLGDQRSSRANRPD